MRATVAVFSRGRSIPCGQRSPLRAATCRTRISVGIPTRRGLHVGRLPEQPVAFRGKPGRRGTRGTTRGPPPEDKNRSYASSRSSCGPRPRSDELESPKSFQRGSFPTKSGVPHEAWAGRSRLNWAGQLSDSNQLTTAARFSTHAHLGTASGHLHVPTR